MTVLNTLNSLLKYFASGPAQYCQRKAWAPKICPYCNNTQILVDEMDHPYLKGFTAWYWYCSGKDSKCYEDLLRKELMEESTIFSRLKRQPRDEMRYTIPFKIPHTNPRKTSLNN